MFISLPRKTLLPLLLAALLSPALFGQQLRGLKILAAEALGGEVTVGRQIAVFIAVDRYQHWSPLQNPVRDAREIRGILEENYFIDESIELFDEKATAAGIRLLFQTLRRQVEQNDSVFVFYAGHGQTDEVTNTGSWIPVDAGTDVLSQTNWVPNSQVRSLLAALPARHVFLVSDACFSGDIMETSRGSMPEFSSDYYRRAYSRVSRQVMSSGSSEKVPDSSEFAARFKQALQRNEEACLDPLKIFSTVREVRATQPLLGVIPNSGHQSDGGFIFFRKSPEERLDVSFYTPQTTPIVPRPFTPPAAGNTPAGGKPTNSRFFTPANFWSAGAKVGSAFSAPLLAGTIHGSVSFLPYSFLDVGVDAGFLASQSVRDAAPGLERYASIFPFAHYNAGWVSENLAVYGGIGGGWLAVTYGYADGSSRSLNLPAFDALAGLWFHGFDLSLTVRTDFGGASVIAAAGYSWRF